MVATVSSRKRSQDPMKMLKCDVLRRAVLQLGEQGRLRVVLAPGRGRLPRGGHREPSLGSYQAVHVLGRDCWQSVGAGSSWFLEKSNVWSWAGAAARAWAHLVLLQGQPFPVPMALLSLPGGF